MFPARAGMNRVVRDGYARSDPVFPARAGMNRSREQLTAIRRVVFPARAGMNRRGRARRPGYVFPARAGMNRSQCERHVARANVPRTRGDEPIGRVDDTQSATECSPHARG